MYNFVVHWDGLVYNNCTNREEDESMKIKWKIVLSTMVNVSLVVLIFLYLTQESLSEVVLERTTEDLGNTAVLVERILEEQVPGDWTLENGLLSKGNVVINGNYEVVEDLTEGLSINYTVYQGNQTAVTSVRDLNGQRQSEVAIETEAVDIVMNQKGTHTVYAQVNGKNVIRRYMPIEDAIGQVIGISTICVEIGEVEDTINAIIMVLIMTALSLLILSLIGAYFTGNMIAAGIVKVRAKIQVMETGDFTIASESRVLTAKDEVGGIARSCEAMKDNIFGAVAIIQQEANVIRTHAQKTLADIEQIDETVEDISGSTEELSASMEETTAFTEEINAATAEIKEEIGNMKQYAVEMNTLSTEIKERAESLNEQSKHSHAVASDIYNQTNVQLRQSMEKANAISEIQELTENILKITAQTNLLAINASIEATRAGEAGKGFAVVADQIRLLAENSKSAVSSISRITKNVSEAVESVLKDAGSLLEFVDTQVLKDYEILLETSVQYNTDADSVYDSVEIIGKSTGKLYDSIDNISVGINEITSAALHGAEGTVAIAEKIVDISKMTREVKKQSHNNQNSIEELGESVKFFRLNEEDQGAEVSPVMREKKKQVQLNKVFEDDLTKKLESMVKEN